MLRGASRAQKYVGIADEFPNGSSNDAIMRGSASKQSSGPTRYVWCSAPNFLAAISAYSSSLKACSWNPMENALTGPCPMRAINPDHRAAVGSAAQERAQFPPTTSSWQCV